MKVYLVQHVQFDAGWVIPQTYKVFKNKEKAVAYAEERRRGLIYSDREDIQIAEFEVE